ncbi:MAG: HAD hydrolase family protein [Syntrophales bacterium]|jgi:3-deoxy-D-manno-octulosonate 8-phosphate phosphatase (KDO 8-P phosphatase)|nr:HAD hydrolase family protein [Syntrophales bacterium]MCK9527451.1 HAD hydrolase family protein [Syntrophales bacterium]MDX9921555.1 HAD hydrolase family protein [Syntrophales bacterium]
MRAISDNLTAQIADISLLMTDVDGVLTDGGIIMDHQGRELKKFNVRDGHGIKMLLRYGIGVVFLTGRKSAVVEKRALDLGITEVYQGVKNKGPFLIDYLGRTGLLPGEIAYVGDDIVDIPVFRIVGFSVAVADAGPETRASADYVTEARGGGGAVREVCELILKAKSKWPDVVRRYGID